MAAQQSPLRRWKRFLPAFGAIDAAVEVSDSPAVRRMHGMIRRVRAQIVEELRGARDGGVAEEELFLVLDDVMAESLVTLSVVPVTASALASTDLARAVGALGEHESARVRGFARDVVRGWRASVEGDIARARAAMAVLEKLADDEKLPPEGHPSVVASARSSHVPVAAGYGEKKRQAKGAPPPPPTKTASPLRSNRVEPAKIDKPAKVSAPLPKKSASLVGAGRANMGQLLLKKTPAVAGNRGGELVGSDKMEAAKRKLHEGYQEAAEAKQRRKIQVIEAPKMVEQRQRKMHPIIRERSQARCGISTAAVRRSLLPSLQRI